MEDLYRQTNAWLDEVVYFDEGVRRDLILDVDRDRIFFFADPLDFDKDDTHIVARYWIDECEGYEEKFDEEIRRSFLH